MTASRSSATPSPVLAEMRRMSRAGMPSTCSISAAYRSGSAAGRSILLRQATTSRSFSSGQVAVGQSLGLDALGGVDDEDDRLAGGQRPAHLVGEVDVTRGVDQVDDVVVPGQPNRLELDRDSPLPLQVHRVEVLGPHVSGVDGPRQLEHPIGQRRLAVVDVGDDRRVAYAVEFHGSGPSGVVEEGTDSGLSNRVAPRPR